MADRKPLYRVFINNGHGGAKLLCSLNELGTLAFGRLVEQKEDVVSFMILPLKSQDKRLDGIERDDFAPEDVP